MKALASRIRSSHSSLQAGPDHLRVGRLVEIGQHRGGPLGHVHGRYAAADVVHIIGVAVIAGMDWNHAAQVVGVAGRQLQRGESTPRNPDHADRPGAPGAVGEPCNHALGVELLLLAVLVFEEPGGVAAPTQIHAGIGEPVGSEIGTPRGVTDRRAIALAVGDRVEDG